MKLSICISGQETPDISQLIDSSYKKREIIFFDEILCGHIIVSDADKHDFEDYDLYLEIGIIPKELVDDDLSYSIKSFVISSTLVTDLVFDESVDGVKFNVYKFVVPISYPKRKLVDPQVIFNGYTQNKVVSKDQSVEAVMKDYQPLNERNLLQELNISTEPFHLSGAKSEDLKEETLKNPDPNTAELTNKSNETGAVGITNTLILPIYSALVIKLKTTKPAGKNNELLTCFNIEASEHLTKLSLITTPITINMLDFDIEFTGKVVDMNQGIFGSKNIHFQVGESVNFNYKLVNNESDDQLKQVNVNLQLKILKEQENFQSKRIETVWSPFIDFNLVAPPINNSLKSTHFNNPMQSQVFSKKRNGGNNLVGNTSNFKKYGSTGSIPMNYKRLASTSSMMVNLNSNNNSATNFYGLRLTFNGKLNIKIGEVSNWKLQAINESPNTLNLSMILQNQQPRQHHHTPHHTPQIGARQNPQMSQAQFQSQAQLNGSQAQLEPTPNPSGQHTLTLENKYYLYNLYKSMRLPNQGVIILNNDVRLGPLGPNCVFETEINILGISKGVFSLDGLNIFDLDTGDGLDFGKLVEVFVT